MEEKHKCRRYTCRSLLTIVLFGKARSEFSKLAIFDLESFMLKPRRGQFKLEWISKIKELYYAEKYEIAIITDQKKKADIEAMSEMVYAALQIPLVFVGGHTNPYYNKPHIGLFKCIVEDFCDKKVLKSESFYVGNNVIDSTFARNAGLEFRWGQEFWGLDAPIPIIPVYVDPLDGLIEIGEPPKIVLREKHLILTVGPGASGKDKISEPLMWVHQYKRFNRYRSKLQTIQMKPFTQAIAMNQSIVVDDCHASFAERAQWMVLAKAAGYYTTIVYIDIPRHAAEYLNNYRFYATERSSFWITTKEYDDYYSSLDPPLSSEADEVITMDRLYVKDDATRIALTSFRQ